MRLFAYLLFLSFVYFCNGSGLLESILEDPVPSVTDAERLQMAADFANARYVARTNLFNSFKNLLSTSSDATFSIALSAHHQLSHLAPSMETAVTKAEYYNDFATKYSEGLTDNDRWSIMDWNSREITDANPVDNQVPSYPDCSACDSSSRYRTLDGMCNNLVSCKHGATGVTYRRLLPAEYGEHGAPRPAATDPWAIARDEFGVTKDITQRVTSSRFLSQMLMLWGQFAAHDNSATPGRSTHDSAGKPIEVNCEALTEDQKFDDCMVMNYKSMVTANFLRSAPGIIDKDNKLVYGNREQFNMQTAFFDASHIYGTTVEQRDKLVDMQTGFMKVSHISPVATEKFPPTDPDQYCDGATGNNCFISGDGRINVHLGMSMIHALFTRHHDLIAQKLKEKHSDWDGTQIYEETRRIIGAIMQSITYKQYLPYIIGPDMITRYGLDLTGGTTYNPSIDPTMINSFVTAAFRMGHSQVYNSVRMASSDGTLGGTAGLVSTMFNPDKYYDPGNGHTILRRYMSGLALDRCEEVDSIFSKSISLDMFKSPHPERPNHRVKGLSLPAINLQRGRDHGLPTCGAFMDLIKLKTGDIPEGIDDPVKRGLDLYHCGLDEPKMPGAEVGLTFGHIIATQYRKTMMGDRFFYTHTGSDNPGAFTAAEIAEIDKVTISEMMCRHINTQLPDKNLFDIKLAPDAFITAEGPNNSMQDCDDVIIPAGPDYDALLA